MTAARIALVCHDATMRMRVARAFDTAPLEWSIRLFDAPPPDADVVVRLPGSEGEGIELDLDDPGRTLSEIESRLKQRASGKVIEIVSTGGGTGCTSVALHLASYLSADAPALYVECDRDRGGRLRLGLESDGPSWSEIEGPGDLASATVPVPGGFRALLSGTGDEEVPERCVEWGSARHPFVVLDRGPRSPSVCDRPLVLLMGPSIPAARRANAILQRTSRGPCAVVTNRLGPGSEATTEMLETVTGCRITLSLPCSASLRDHEDEGRLLPRQATVWSRRVGMLADALRRA